MGWCLVAPSMAPSVEGRVYVEDAGRTYRENGAAAGRVGVLQKKLPAKADRYAVTLWYYDVEEVRRASRK